jgi:hypothetical protein
VNDIGHSAEATFVLKAGGPSTHDAALLFGLDAGAAAMCPDSGAGSAVIQTKYVKSAAQAIMLALILPSNCKPPYHAC